MTKKIFAALILALFVMFVTSCKIPTLEKEEPKLEVELIEEDIGISVSEVDSIEDDLNMPELDELDDLIKELESD